MHVQENKVKDAANLFVEDYCEDSLDHSKDCPSKNIFNRIYLEINNVLDKIYLSDMLESNKKGIN